VVWADRESPKPKTQTSTELTNRLIRATSFSSYRRHTCFIVGTSSNAVTVNWLRRTSLQGVQKISSSRAFIAVRIPASSFHKESSKLAFSVAHRLQQGARRTLDAASPRDPMCDPFAQQPNASGYCVSLACSMPLGCGSYRTLHPWVFLRTFRTDVAANKPRWDNLPVAGTIAL